MTTTTTPTTTPGPVRSYPWTRYSDSDAQQYSALTPYMQPPASSATYQVGYPVDAFNYLTKNAAATSTGGSSSRTEPHWHSYQHAAGSTAAPAGAGVYAVAPQAGGVYSALHNSPRQQTGMAGSTAARSNSPSFRAPSHTHALSALGAAQAAQQQHKQHHPTVVQDPYRQQQQQLLALAALGAGGSAGALSSALQQLQQQLSPHGSSRAGAFSKAAARGERWML